MADLAEMYGASVDSQAAGAPVSGASLPDPSTQQDTDYIATSPDPSHVSSAMAASQSFTTNMLDHARVTIGQHADAVPVLGPGSAYSPDQMDTGQYTLPPEHDTLIKTTVGKTLDRASQAWQDGSVDDGSAAADAAPATSGGIYDNWLTKADQDLWTNPLGAISVPAPQATNPLWDSTGADRAEDQSAAGEARFMGMFQKH